MIESSAQTLSTANGTPNGRTGAVPAASAPMPGTSPDVISILRGSPFENDVLYALLAGIFRKARITLYASEEEWKAQRTGSDADEILLYNLEDRRISDEAVKRALEEFIESAGDRNIILMSRIDDAMAVFDAIDCGASAYIPPGAGVNELVEAISARTSTSVVIPRSSMAAMREALGGSLRQKPGLEQYFTERQLAVAHALKRGGANKTIAYELGLCESTVKVHIRNIMRKLKATNRTQAAFRLNELANGKGAAEYLADEGA